jgi:hypothetical protein
MKKKESSIDTRVFTQKHHPNIKSSQNSILLFVILVTEKDQTEKYILFINM